MLVTLSDARVRRRSTPTRIVTSGVVVASLRSGEPLHLPATANAIWEALAFWTDRDLVVQRIAEAFPDITQSEVTPAVDEILGLLLAEDLLELRND